MKQSILTDHMRELRKKCGYTQEDVSLHLNIQRQTYCNYENASRTPPLDIIIALAELYHVSIDYLICGEKEAAAPAPAPAVLLNETEQALVSEFSLLPEQSQKDVMNFIQFKKLFPPDILS